MMAKNIQHSALFMSRTFVPFRFREDTTFKDNRYYYLENGEEGFVRLMEDYLLLLY